MSGNDIDKILAERRARRQSETTHKAESTSRAKAQKAAAKQQAKDDKVTQLDVLQRLQQRFIGEVGGRINLNPAFGMTGSLPILKHFTRAALLTVGKQGANYALIFKHNSEVRGAGILNYWAQSQYMVQGRKNQISYDPASENFSWQTAFYERRQGTSQSSDSNYRSWISQGEAKNLSESEVINRLKECVADHVEAHGPLNKQLLVKSAIAGAIFWIVYGSDITQAQERNGPVSTESSLLINDYKKNDLTLDL